MILIRTKANKGYAFVNFTNPTGASRMYQAYHNFRWECLPIKKLNFRSKKVCEISPAKIQVKLSWTPSAFIFCVALALSLNGWS